MEQVMDDPLIVLKFGGTALGSSRRIRLAARRLIAWHHRGFRVVAVASATGHTTDRIARRLAAVGASPAEEPGPETDRALATGELLSSALLAAALLALGAPARSLSGRDAGLLASGPWGAAVLEDFDPEPLEVLLRAGLIPVIAGFQAGTSSGDLITLGRGASDLSAVFLAARLVAAECHIVTDVAGVFDRDPRREPGAVRLARLSPAALSTLAESGAQVVHLRAAQLALMEQVPLRVYRWDASRRGEPGSFVVSEVPDRAAG
jgi:aspartate kinase